MPHRATEIANEFLRRAEGGLTQMQLQKLAFIANGWNVAINDEPLIGDQAEAWDYGPVYPDLYDHTKFFGKESVCREIRPDDDHAVAFFLPVGTHPQPYRAHLTPREEQVIDAVWRKYGGLDGIELSQLTHRAGTPWSQVYRTAGKNRPIPAELIAEHYRELADRGRQAQTAA